MQSSPPKTTPTGKNVKALPTARDHTTDQVNPEGDEYIPREVDEAGEKKVTPSGHLNGEREYKCRTFVVQNRGDKLFMLATECAKVLNYRDSYLLFNKNRSLYKIIATYNEKQDLIAQTILPNSYRSRQIAIVAARSMFRQFGARMIVNGRRVRDDYWETKARKQGFSEDDLASEKRPSASKPKESVAEAPHGNAATAMNMLAQGEIIYSNAPTQFHANAQMPGPVGMGGIMSGNLASLGYITTAEDLRARDYGNIHRPRQDMTGLPYQDRTQSSSIAEIVNQAAQTADLNHAINRQRGIRGQYLQDAWRRPHEPDVSSVPPQAQRGENEDALHGEQVYSSPQPARQRASSSATTTQQSLMSQQAGTQMTQMKQIMNPQVYAQQQLHQQQQPYPIAQSPVQRLPQAPLRADPLQPQPQRTPSYTYGSAVGQMSQPSYGYSPAQMWPPPQPNQSSPISQTHHLSHYGQQQLPQTHAQQQLSPHIGQSPRHALPQLPHQHNSSSMHGIGTPLGYQQGLQGHGMAGLPNPGYPGISQGRSIYPPSASPQQQQPQQQQQQQMMSQSNPGQPGSMHGWAPAPTSHGHQGWPSY